MYDYKTEKQKLFTEEGAKTLLAVYDKIMHGCSVAGCITRYHARIGGDSWTGLAAQDFLEETNRVWINKEAPSTNDQTIHLRGA